MAAGRATKRVMDSAGVDISHTGIERDPAQAIPWLRKAAEQKHVKAQSMLGVIYDVGRGTAADLVEAVRWYRAAAEQGDAVSQYVLGMKYHQGEGVERDEVRAFLWLSLAASQGVEQAATYRDEAAASMSAEQISEALGLATGAARGER